MKFFLLLPPLCALLFLAVPVEAQVTVKLGNVMREQMSGQVTQSDLMVDVDFNGAPVAAAKAMRSVVTAATDDTGADLLNHNSMAGSWNHTFGTAPRLTMTTSVKAPSPKATMIKTFSGEQDFYEPANDPASTVKVENFQALGGKPVVSPALAAAGVEITISAKEEAPAAAAAATATPAPTPEITIVPLGGGTPAPADTSQAKKKRRKKKGGAAKENSVTLACKDLAGKLVLLEFQDASGQVIRDTGWSGSTENGVETRDYTFKDKLPDTARLVIYVETEKSVLKVPFHFTNVPLPPAGK